MKNLISAFFFPRFRLCIGLYSKTRKRKRGNSLRKSRLPGSSFIPKNRRRLCLLAPFYLVLSEDYIFRDFRDFRGFRVFDLAGSSFIPKNRRRLCLLTPFYLVLSEDYIFRDFRDFRSFRVFDRANFEQFLGAIDRSYR